MLYEVKVDMNKDSGYVTVGEYNEFIAAWEEFVNQCSQITNEDKYIKVVLTNRCKKTEYRFAKDETIPYPDHGTLYRIDEHGEREECTTCDSPDMQVESWTEEPHHFLTINNRFGVDIVDVETTEEIMPEYLIWCKSGFWYKDEPFGRYVICGEY